MKYKCARCGAEVAASDTFCEKCGAPQPPRAYVAEESKTTVRADASRETVRATVSAEPPAPVSPSGRPVSGGGGGFHGGNGNGNGNGNGGGDKPRRTGMVYLVAALAVALVALIVYLLVSGHQRKVEADIEEAHRRDSIEAARVAEQQRQDSLQRIQDSIADDRTRREKIYDAYVTRITSAKGNFYDDANAYYLFDITGDGIPELWIEWGTCEADRETYVYTADKATGNVSLLDKLGTDHRYPSLINGYLTYVFVHSGYYAAFRMTYSNDKIMSTTIYEDSYYDHQDNEDWEPNLPAGKPVEGHTAASLYPIRSSLGLP